MNLVGAKSFPKQINIPTIAINKVTVLTNCILTETEVTLFNASIKAVCEYIQNENISLDDYFSFNVVFTTDGSFAIQESSNNSLGRQFQLAIYDMEKLRNLKDSEMMLFVFLEELCHYFFRISDERAVKYRVEEIFKIFHPTFDLSDFRRRYSLNGFQ